MNRNELQREVRDTLAKAGFYVSEIYCMRSTGFDLVARRDNTLLIIKVLTNIDAMTEDLAKELKKLSFLLKACPLIIGEKNSSGFLQDDVVYDRFEIRAITSQTLKNHLLEGIPLEIYAAPGGFYVNLDGNKIRELRKEQNISIGEFARSVRVTRRTVQMYEEGMSASVEVALRIEDLFGTGVTVPIDITSYHTSDREVNLDSPTKKSFREFQKEIFSILEDIGYKVIPIERCPFEAVSKDRNKILLTCVDQYDRKLLKKAKVVRSISSITEKHAVLIVDKEVNRKNIEGTPIIVKKELKKLHDTDDIIDLIIERLSPTE